MNLLIIEDDEAIAGLYQKIAKPYFKKIYTGEQWDEIEEILKLHEMDLILCDVNLNQGLGSELLIGLRHLVGRSKVYFISCSEHIGHHCEHAKAFGLNVVGCDTKPVEVEELSNLFKSCATT